MTAVRTTLDLHVLDGARPLHDFDIACLPSVARVLVEDSYVLIATFDDETQQVLFYQQAEWLPAGHHSIKRVKR